MLPPGLTISDDPARLDLELIHTWLSEQAYWAVGQSRSVTERSFAGARCSGVYAADGRQVAVARVVTDGVKFAWVCDVFVDPDRRGQRIGESLVRHVVDVLTHEGVPRIVLATRDAHEVYARVGFEPLRFPGTWLEIDRRPQRLAVGPETPIS